MRNKPLRTILLCLGFSAIIGCGDKNASLPQGSTPQVSNSSASPAFEYSEDPTLALAQAIKNEDFQKYAEFCLKKADIEEATAIAIGDGASDEALSLVLIKEKGAYPTHWKASLDGTLATVAAHQNIPGMKRLIEAGATLDRALIRASSFNRAKAIPVLIEQGANPNADGSKSQYFNSPIRFAAYLGNLEAVEQLLQIKGLDVNSCGFRYLGSNTSTCTTAFDIAQAMFTLWENELNEYKKSGALTFYQIPFEHEHLLAVESNVRVVIPPLTNASTDYYLQYVEKQVHDLHQIIQLLLESGAKTGNEIRPLKKP